MRAELETAGLPPSAQIARLARLVQRLDSRRNQFFAPIDLLTFWTVHVACAIERWRAACGPAFARWLHASGEFEALCALAGYAYEQPDAIFPELLPAHPPRFEAEALAHPLLPLAKAVGNDVRLGGESTVWIVSGSNMSGKSTLLRAVGVNTVLALAGAPVRARSLRLSPLAVGASIQVRDSLQQGKSRFYAEITRIKAVLELGQQEGGDKTRPALLFLLDEILHGTNSHDRRIGAEAIVRGLVATGAIGLVTTHDLALTRLAEALVPRVVNVHFQDTLEDGRMHFDFHLRPGVVEKSNALELMRAVGLKV